MKREFSGIAFLAMTCAVGTLLSFTANAADDPAPPQPGQPAQPAQPVQSDTNARANRIRGGNPPDANVQGQRGGRTFAGFGGLNLDQKQNELLREAMQAESDELRKLNDKLQAAQKELVQAVIAEKYDEKSVREKADAVAKIQADMMALRAKAFATVAPTLKPEQREQIENSRAASGFITGGGFMFGGGPGGPGFQPQEGPPQDRALRRNNGGDPTQGRRRGGPPGTPGQ